MKRKYFFGYLFVRFAKLIALLVFLGGCGYAIYLYAMANLKAETIRYRPSRELDVVLDALDREIGRTISIINTYQSDSSDPEVKFQKPTLLRGAEKPSNFEQLQTQLGAVESLKGKMKNTLLEKLEENVGLIQSKLRAHAAAVAAEEASKISKKEEKPAPAPSASPTPSPTPVLPSLTKRIVQTESLFPGDLAKTEIEERKTTLEKCRNYLGVLEAGAENPENKAVLTTIATELNRLQKLLPEKLDLVETATKPVEPVERTSQQPVEPRPQPRVPLSAERVAERLAQLYSEVRNAMLTSWRLDSALERAVILTANEHQNCIRAWISLKALWLERLVQIGIALLCGTFSAFFLLVLADITQSFLDTATNTGEMAKRLTTETK